MGSYQGPAEYDHSATPTHFVDEEGDMVMEEPALYLSTSEPRTIAETDEEEDEEDEDDAETISPIMRSSFLAHSALPLSPHAVQHTHRTVSIADTDGEEEDDESHDSESSAARQLIFERGLDHTRPLSISDDDDEEVRLHRPPAKRQRTQSISSFTHRHRHLPSTSMAYARQVSIPLGRSPALQGERAPKESFDESDSDAHSSSDPLQSQRLDITLQPHHTEHLNERPHDHDAHEAEQAGEEDDNDNDDDDEAEEEEYAVEAILGHSYQDGTKYYLVKWEGYGEATDWLSEDALEGAAEMVAEYNERQRRKKGKERRE
jgi:hypothetical protein